MGDGIINLANLGWVVVLGGAVYLVNHLDAVPAQHIETLRNSWGRVTTLPPLFAVVLLWLVARILFALGWQLQLELLLVMIVCNYGVRQTRRAKSRAAQDLRRELTSSTNPSAVLGPHLPEWVTFPSANRVQWLNGVIVSLWPSIVGATETSLRAVMEPLLEKHKPSFLYGFRIKSASIGSVPVVINGMQHHAYGTTETTLDINVSWTAAMDIRLLVRVPGPDVEVIVSDFEMKMTLRVVLGPHIPQWPCFGNMAVSIVNTPDLDFNISAAKISLDAVPGLGSFLDHFIRRILVGMLAYPKSLVIPIVKGYDMKRGLGRGALGTLKLHFLRIDNVASKYSKYKKTPFYCKLALDGQSGKRLRTLSYTGFASPMKDVFTFTLYDNTGTLNVWFAFDVVGSDLHVGQCTVATKVLMETDMDEVELVIVKESDASHARRVAVYVRPEFLAFTAAQRETAVAGPPSATPPRMPSRAYVEGVETGKPPSVPRSRMNTPRSSFCAAAINSGTLFVHVDRANDLKNIETLGTSDPYVLLRIGDSVWKTPYVSDTLNPVFNCDGELAVTNWETDVLRVRLIDKNVTADKLMAELQMPLTKIVQRQEERLSGTFKLDPQGTITFTATFKRHS
ncbi:C2 domain containing protein [Novymonas esmeraldas]|uniref:C2 domain containing protein n=1 Tax=Novymonas esmeraldas TaxID=1808958 RepID=A0AAW0EQG7_9TRYP